MSENEHSSDARLHYFGPASVIRSLKEGFLPLEPGTPLTFPFAQFDRWHGDQQRPLTAEALEAEWRRQYQAMPEAVRGLLGYDHFRNQGGAIEEDVKAAARRRQSTGQAHYDPDWLGQARVLRLFPSALCYTGWRWLAEDFSGLAVALNSRHPDLASSRERPSRLAPVGYGEPHRFKVTSDNPFPGLLNDHASQRDNQEWRLLMPARTAPRRQDQAALPVSRGLVAGLFWSVATPDSVVDEIRLLVRRDMRYRSVRLGRVVPDVGHWRLALVPE